MRSWYIEPVLECVVVTASGRDAPRRSLFGIRLGHVATRSDLRGIISGEVGRNIDEARIEPPPSANPRYYIDPKTEQWRLDKSRRSPS